MEDNYINSHLVQWKKLIEASLECFERGDIGEMQKYKDMADSEYEQYMSNETNEMHNESISFGFGNYIVENNIVRFLKKKNKKALSEYKKIIKEDKNLSNEYKLINSLLNFKKSLSEDVDTYDYINECLDFVSHNIDRKTINESNNKILNFIEKYNLKLDKDISDDMYDLFENIDYLLKNKKDLNNLQERRMKINLIAKTIDNLFSNNKENVNENKDKTLTIDEFQEKYGDSLNEEEKNFIKNIMESEENRTNLFNETKIECLDKINSLMNENKESDIANKELKVIKEQLEVMEFSNDNPYESIIKLFNIKDILSEE